MPIIACPKCGAKNRVDERAAELQPVCGKCGAKLQPATSSKPLTLTDTTFTASVLNASVPVLVDCWAPWCPPCRAIAPSVDALAGESAGRYVVGKLNVDDNPKVAGQYRIDSIPTLLIFKNGKVVDQIVGLQSKDAIARTLLSHI